MSIVSVKRDDSNRYAVYDSTDGWTAVDSWVVVTDDPVNDTAAEVCRAPGLPFADQQHSEIPTIFVTNIEAQQRGDSMVIWDVYVNYGQAELLINPLLESVQLAWGAIRTQEPFWKDVDGIPLANSAGVPIDPPVMRDVTRPTLVATRNEPDFQIANFIPFYDTVNLDYFFGAAPGQAKFVSVTGDGPNIRNGVTYWTVNYEFHFRQDRWDVMEILDRGLYELIPPDTPGQPWRLRHIEVGFLRRAGALPFDLTAVEDSVPITEAVPLNGDGRVLPAKDENGQPSALFYLHVRPYRSMNFASLPWGSLENPFPVPP